MMPINRGTIQLLPGTASPSTRRDFEDLRMQTRRNLTVALRLLDEDEREDIIESLDSEYNNQARAELEALLVDEELADQVGAD